MLVDYNKVMQLPIKNKSLNITDFNFTIKDYGQIVFLLIVSKIKWVKQNVRKHVLQIQKEMLK